MEEACESPAIWRHSIIWRGPMRTEKVQACLEYEKGSRVLCAVSRAGMCAGPGPAWRIFMAMEKVWTRDYGEMIHWGEKGSIARLCTGTV